MSDDRSEGQGRDPRDSTDPTNPYGRPGAGQSGAGESGAGESGPDRRPEGSPGGPGDRQRPAPQWSSATQRREHPDAGSPGGGAAWSDSGQAQAGQPVLRRRAGAGSAFLVALLATLAGLAVALLAGYTAFHGRSLPFYARINLASGGLQAWPSGPRSSIHDLDRVGLGNFVLTFAVAGVVLLVLLWAVLGSTPGGRGAFAMLLAGWGATLVAGAVAVAVAYLTVAQHGSTQSVLTMALNSGADWAIRVGWVVGVVAAIGQLMRRRDRYEV